METPKKKKVTQYTIGYRKGYLKGRQDERLHSDITYQTLRKKMTWIPVDDTKMKCPHCEIISFIAMYPPRTFANFCPNCGQPMQTKDNP